ncbi:LysR family transcriptional regulator [Paracoccus sp. (in: a-proteobacteria)]|uniref:LysR family transcriptional regulator n=1 Tax=Paracoccus sp. TaxID=267 RepID=UPI0026E03443|nr:LysR family transcriptional regulator [Paracoccus sp. (in: a-proteobacteria)]MDO5371205.1 LysR family transcriptional regulator [Paracoccus sp. (in: a-proteobacteria)]
MDAFDHRFLREFTVVAQEGSIRRAAERLNIVSSSISRKISDAEIRLGVKLFARHSQGMHLTEAGKLLLDHATHIRNEQDYVRELIGQYRDDTRRVIRLGVGEGFAADLMQNGLAALMQAHPNLRYQISTAGTDRLVEQVALDQVDLAIAYNPILVPGTRSLAIGRQPLCAIVPAASPLIGRKGLRLADVLDQPLALLNESHGIRQLLARAASDQGLALRPVVETQSITLLIRFVSAGLGVTFLPRFSAAIQQARGELAVLDLDEPLLLGASAHAVTRARRRLPKSVEAVAALLATRMAAFLPPALP